MCYTARDVNAKEEVGLVEEAFVVPSRKSGSDSWRATPE
jgi:hypothetical protein